MAERELAETVILQSIADLWDKKLREECNAFFCGQGFSFWADAANIKISDRRIILFMILNSVTHEKSHMQGIHI